MAPAHDQSWPRFAGVIAGLPRPLVVGVLGLPIYSLDSAHKIEMAVPAEEGERMLTAERGNPNVVGRNWSSGSLEFGSNSSVRDGRLFIHIEYPAVANRFGQPLFVALPVA